MRCFVVPYSHLSGKFTATKWADSPEGALAAVQASHRDVGMSRSPKVGVITYGVAVAMAPQPFSHEGPVARDKAAMMAA